MANGLIIYMSDIEDGFVAKVVWPNCGAVVYGNVPAKPEYESFYSYSKCSDCKENSGLRDLLQGLGE